jgi:hypothetical protein
MHLFHYIYIVHDTYLSPVEEVPLHLLIASKLSGKNPPWGAEPGTEVGPALQQADVILTELLAPSRSYAAPYFATPHSD